MTKIPQVKPDWNTGIYIGDGVVATPKPKTGIIDKDKEEAMAEEMGMYCTPYNPEEDY